MQLFSMARNPVPSGARVGGLDMPGGFKIRYAIWKAARSPLKGTVCIFQGFGESIEKYFEVVADLRRRGYGVAILDWRALGGSEGPTRARGHVGSFADYDEDVLRFMKDIVLPDCLPPYFAIGHSMGGHVMLRFSTMETCWFERMVLTGPMIEIHPSKLGAPRGVIRALTEFGAFVGAGGLAPTTSDVPWGLRPFEGNLLTTDLERFERNRAVLEAYPYLGVDAPTVSWVRAALRSSNMLGDEAFQKSVKVPLLLVASGSDTIVDNEAIETFAMNVKMGSHILVAGARHEILAEQEALRQQFWAAFDAFVGGEDVLAA